MREIHDFTLEQCELLAVRHLAWLIEAITDAATGRYEWVVPLESVTHLADVIEHLMQDALDDRDNKDLRTNGLLYACEKVTRIMEESGDKLRIRSQLYLPSKHHELYARVQVLIREVA